MTKEKEYAPALNVSFNTEFAGTTVVYTGKNGYPFDHDMAASDGLEVGQGYTVESIRVNNWSADVFLRLPTGISKGYNSVIFCSPQDWEEHVRS